MEQKDIHSISLTKSQQNVLKQIVDFVELSANRVFILKGYAGTGKTTLMRFLIQELEKQEKDYRLLASTGRAAKILANLSNRNSSTSTIHSMIYSFNGLSKEFDEKEEPVADQAGQLFLVFEPTKIDERKDPDTVYIIDEASMVSDIATADVTQAQFGEGRLLKELLDYDPRPNSKFIFVGDPCQLPPITEYYSPALSPDYFQNTFNINAQEAQLTEIMRQKGTSGIIDASKQIRSLYTNAPNVKTGYGRQRLWGFLPFRQYGDIQLHNNLEEMIDDYVAKFQKGDLLMIIQNNLPTGLMNGDMVTIEEIADTCESRGGLTFRQVKVKELFTQCSYTTLIIEEIVNQSRLNLDSMQQQSLFIDFIVRMRNQGIKQKDSRFNHMMFNDPYLNALRCVYGYAITCHKSQGGEWDDVYVHVPRNITLNPIKETYQWIYTAMTRAKKTLHMIDDFFIK